MRTPEQKKRAYEAKRKWERANPEKYRALKKRLALKKYGLTPDSYESLWMTQGKRCKICRADSPSSRKGWQIDHCHTTGVVRGILCTHCNRMLAGALDNPAILEAGAAFLRNICSRAA